MNEHLSPQNTTAIKETPKKQTRQKKSYSPKDVASKKWTHLKWGEKWSKPFGYPATNAAWFISGASAQGKSSFVMQLGKELCKYGHVLYVSYEEGVSESFQRRMGYLNMHEQQGKFRVITEDTYNELQERLAKPKSPKFIIIDSFQVATQEFDWTYKLAVDMMKRFRTKCFIFISQEYKSEPLGKPAVSLKYISDMKVRVMGYKAYCLGRSISEAGSHYVVWADGVLKTSNVKPKSNIK